MVTIQQLGDEVLRRFHTHPSYSPDLEDEYRRVYTGLAMKDGQSLTRVRHDFHTSRNPLEVRARIRDLLNETMGQLVMQNYQTGEENDVFIFSTSHEGSIEMIAERTSDGIWFTGKPAVVAEAKRAFATLDIDTEYPVTKLTWNAQHKSVNQESTWFSLDQLGHDCFWPYVEGGVQAYVQDFLNSSASVLLFIGEAGTGKSTLARTIIARHKLKAAVGYDPDVAMSPETYNYLQSHHVFVEDADAFIGKRETEGNVLMSTILNATEGIIKRSTTNKLIISTNLPGLNKVDEALWREGRCYGVVHFRSLTVPEARAVQEATGNFQVDLSTKPKWKLSQILSPSHHINSDDLPRAAGFS